MAKVTVSGAGTWNFSATAGKVYLAGWLIDYIGTGGLSFSDSNQTVRSTVMGLFDEWHRRIEQDYQQRGVALRVYQSLMANGFHLTKANLPPGPAHER